MSLKFVVGTMLSCHYYYYYYYYYYFRCVRLTGLISGDHSRLVRVPLGSHKKNVLDR